MALLRRRTGAVFAALMVGAAAQAAMADRGSIRPVGKVNVEEPAQRAIIVHDGVCRELLILQTDVRADKPTKIVEFMPLPGKPEVSLAPKGCFAALADIVAKHGLRYYAGGGGGRRGNGAGPAEPVKVVVEAHLGPHAITAVEVEDLDAFIKWITEFFRKNDLGAPAIDADLRQVVGDYLKRDIRFFVFDVVSLSAEQKTVEPVAYRFASENIYYPLKVTNLYGPSGAVELFTILPDDSLAVVQFRAGAATRPAGRPPRLLSSNAVTPDANELAALHPGIAGLTRGRPGVMRAARYEGPLSFAYDIDIPPFHGPDSAARKLLTAVSAGDSAGARAMAAEPFELNGQTHGQRDAVVTALLSVGPDLRGGGWDRAAATYAGPDDLAANFGQAFIRHWGPTSLTTMKVAAGGRSVLACVATVPGRGRKVVGLRTEPVAAPARRPDMPAGADPNALTPKDKQYRWINRVLRPPAK